MKPTRSDRSPASQTSVRPRPLRRTDPLYFFPEHQVTDAELRRTLAEGSHDQRCWAISHLLRYAQWEDIWTYVSRDEVREIFPDLDLPESLQNAWGRMLKLEVPVG